MNTGSLNIEGLVTMQELATPSAPVSGFHELYFKADGNLYTQAYSGVETMVLQDAPSDGTIYGRCNGAWVDVPNNANWTSNVCGNGYTLTDVGYISAYGPITAQTTGCSCYVFTGILGSNLGGCDAGGYFCNNYNGVYTSLSTYEGWGVYTNGPIQGSCICGSYFYGDGSGLTNLSTHECLCGLCDVSIPSYAMCGYCYGCVLCWNGYNWNLGSVCSGGCGGGWSGCACTDLCMQGYSICCAFNICGCYFYGYFCGDGSCLSNVQCSCYSGLAYYACYLCGGGGFGGWSGSACSDLCMNYYNICCAYINALSYYIQGYSGINCYWMDGNYNWHCTCCGIMIN
jgi:hypothetical protein